MQSYDYLAVPAPSKGQKIKGLKTPAERYAHQLTVLLNELSVDGWEYWRSDCLPSEERKGFTGTTTVQNHLLIFRRPSAEALAENPPLDTPARPAAPSIGVPQQGYADVRREPMFRDPPLRDTDPDPHR